MNINKSSLIYKFLTERITASFCYTPPYNLCPYMRHFVLLVLTEFVLGFVVIFLLQSVLFAAGVGIFGIDIGPEWAYLYLLLTVGLITAGILVCIFLLITGVYFFDSNKRTIKETFTKITSPVTSRLANNIFVQWFKAAHDKVCPSLTFK